MKRSLVTIIACILFLASDIVFACITSGPYFGQELDTTVQKAYDLRMQGKVDTAKAILEQAVLQNPNNEAAYYELARIQIHRALGMGTRETLFDMIGEAKNIIDKAVELNPKDVIYTTFSGHVGFLQAYFSLMTGEQSKEKLAIAVESYESALKLKPDYYQVMLYLIELYSQFPEEAGGDKSKAEQYVLHLEGIGVFLVLKLLQYYCQKRLIKLIIGKKYLKNMKGMPMYLKN